MPSTLAKDDTSGDTTYREKYLNERKENRRLKQQLARLQAQLAGRPSSVIADEINAFEQNEEFQWNTAKSPPGSSMQSLGSAMGSAMSPQFDMIVGSPHLTEPLMGGIMEGAPGSTGSGMETGFHDTSPAVYGGHSLGAGYGKARSDSNASELTRQLYNFK